MESHILQQAKQMFAAGEEQAELFVGRTSVRFSLLSSRAGEHGLLVMLSPLFGIHAPRIGYLSRPQRQVASYAAAGATINEIAAALHRSPHTIRDHLKAIYAELNISSRAELRGLVEERYRIIDR